MNQRIKGIQAIKYNFLQLKRKSLKIATQLFLCWAFSTKFLQKFTVSNRTTQPDERSPVRSHERTDISTPLIFGALHLYQQFHVRGKTADGGGRVFRDLLSRKKWHKARRPSYGAQPGRLSSTIGSRSVTRLTGAGQKDDLQLQEDTARQSAGLTYPAFLLAANASARIEGKTCN